MQNLFEPLTINELAIANRLVLGPMAVLAPNPDGRPSEQTIAFLQERARGGVGLIILGGSTGTARCFAESPFKGVLRLDHDDFVDDLLRLTDAVHLHGTPIFAELMAGFGPMAAPTPEFPLIAASPQSIFTPEDQFPKGIHVPGGRATPTPREATIEEIHALQRELVECAVRCRRAGFDGVEVAGHMSYLLSSFLSPRTNWRTDAYGGSLENRARVFAEVVQAIREQVGSAYPVGLRITADEHVDGGQGAEEYAAVAAHIVDAGVDYVALSDGKYESMYRSAPETDADTITDGDAQAFRVALDVPLLLSSIHDPARAAQAIADGHGDAVMLARPLLADPEYPNKVRDGRSAQIVRCDRHNHCMSTMMRGLPIRCSQNPLMGRESEPAVV